jgi:hypothetical protein
MPAKTFGRELGTRYALEGSVREGAKPFAQHWSAHRHRHGRSPVGRALRCRHRRGFRAAGSADHERLRPSQLELTRIARIKHRPSTSLVAYDHYLRGLARIRERTSNSVDDALLLIQKAIGLDPDYARSLETARRAPLELSASYRPVIEMSNQQAESFGDAHASPHQIDLGLADPLRSHSFIHPR